MAGGDRERAHEVGDADRPHEVGDRQVRAPVRLGHLLAERVEPGELRRSAPRPPTARCRRPVSRSRARTRRSRDAVSHALVHDPAGASRGRPRGHPARSRPTRGSSRIAGNAPRSSQVVKNGVQSMRSTSSASGYRSKRAHAQEGRPRADVATSPRRAGSRAPPRATVASRARAGPRARGARVSYSSRMPAVERVAPGRVEQRPRDAHRARGVGHVDHRRRVRRLDLDRRVDARRRGAADQQRRRHALALHQRGDMDHLVQRRRDQPGQPDQVRADLARRLQDPRRRHHDAEVDDLVVVAAQHDAHDVLADVVDVALDRGHHDRAGAPARSLALGLQVGDEHARRPSSSPGRS